MYDDILEEQALLWEMTKEAADASPEFSQMRNYQKIEQSRKRTLEDAYNEGGKDTGRRRDYLRSLAGRGTGYYDIMSARGIGEAMGRSRGTMSAGQLKEVNKALRSKAGRDNIAKVLEGNVVKSIRKSAVRGKLNEQKVLTHLTDAGLSANEAKAVLLREMGAAKRGLYLRGAGKAGLVLGGLGAAGYGANRMMNKKSSYDPVVGMVEDLDGWEFAKEAELRAAEILLENGIDPETFEETYPEHVKLASFPEPGDAHTHEGDYELVEYNEMLDAAAYDILDGLGF